MSARGSLIAQIEETTERMLAQDNAGELEEQAAGLVLIGEALGRGEDEAAGRAAEVLLGMLDDAGWLTELPSWIRMLRMIELVDGSGGVARTVGERGRVVVDGQARLRALGLGGDGP